MKHYLLFLAVAIFSIFIGSQITEGVLLVPYWQSLSAEEFYAYYAEFGPAIGTFYTILTVLAAIIPMIVALYCKTIHSNGFQFALLSSFLAILFVSAFYVYFKGTNELFYQGLLDEMSLEKELITWNYWHWGRIVIEFLSAVFLIAALTRIKLDRSL